MQKKAKTIWKIFIGILMVIAYFVAITQSSCDTGEFLHEVYQKPKILSDVDFCSPLKFTSVFHICSYIISIISRSIQLLLKCMQKLQKKHHTGIPYQNYGYPRRK